MDADQVPSTDNPGWFQAFLDTDGSVLKDEVVCDTKSCGEIAPYYFRSTCCNDVTFTCREHGESYLRHLVKMESEGYTVTCKVCGEKNYPTKFLQQLENVRLSS